MAEAEDAGADAAAAGGGSGRLTRAFVVLTSGGAAAQLLVLLATPVLTVLYEPADFGVLAVYAAVVSVLQVLSTLRFDQALMLPEEDGRAIEVMALSGVSVTLTAVFAAIPSILLATWAAEVTGVAGLEAVMWLIPAGILAGGLNQTLTKWANRIGAYAAMSVSRFAQAVGLVGVQIGLALAGGDGGGRGLVIGYVTGWVVGMAPLLVVVRPRIAEILAVRIPALRRAAGRYRDFPLYGVWGVLFNRAALEAPSIVLATQFGAATAGLFLLARRLILAPVALVGQSASEILFKEGAGLRNDAHTLHRLFTRILGRMSLLAAPPAIAVLVAGPWLMETAFGSEWREAGNFARALVAMFIAFLLASATSSIFPLLERLGRRLVQQAIRFSLAVGAFGVAYLLDASALQTVAAYSVAMAVGYAIAVLFSDRSIRDLPSWTTATGVGAAGTSGPGPVEV